MKNQFTVAAFGIILDEQDRVLLVHRLDYDLWNLPGGTMESGESPWECVIREVKEETGFDVEIIRLAGVYNKPDKNEVCFSFVCKIIGGELTLNEEADQIKYFSVSDIPHNTSAKQVERINDSLQSENIVYKNQIGKSSIELIKEGRL
ncbi:MAG: NUDIX domain-containing protein [Patescibacteria group bacterium]|jgi:ADP-ribose pyrophosphatase YjhB (NUDIX family)